MFGYSIVKTEKLNQLYEHSAQTVKENRSLRKDILSLELEIIRLKELIEKKQQKKNRHKKTSKHE